MNYREAPIEVVVPGVGPSAVAPAREHRYGKDEDRELAPHRGRCRALTLAALLGLIAPVAGVGLLYLLRNGGVAHVGPNAAGALPLEQLDGTDGQPLARMALAWLPVGLVSGALICAFARSSWRLALGVMVVFAGLLIEMSAAASDAIANNERVVDHLGTPLGAAGTWVSLVLLLIGAVVGVGVASLRAPSAA